jgi:hypothetical protein
MTTGGNRNDYQSGKSVTGIESAAKSININRMFAQFFHLAKKGGVFGQFASD